MSLNLPVYIFSIPLDLNRMDCMVDSGLVLVVLIIAALLVCVAVLLFHDYIP